MRTQLFPPWSRPGDVELVQPSRHKPNEAEMLLPPWSRPGVSALDAGFLWLFVPPWSRPGDVAIGSSSLVEF
jgi:hypothetical protein